MRRSLTDSRPGCEQDLRCLSTFNLEEFQKCQRCLDEQRECYSEHAICELERALTFVMAQIDRLCAHADAERVLSRLLEQFGTISQVSSWSDPRRLH